MACGGWSRGHTPVGRTFGSCACPWLFVPVDEGRGQIVVIGETEQYHVVTDQKSESEGWKRLLLFPTRAMIGVPFGVDLSRSSGRVGKRVYGRQPAKSCALFRRCSYGCRLARAR